MEKCWWWCCRRRTYCGTGLDCRWTVIQRLSEEKYRYKEVIVVSQALVASVTRIRHDVSVWYSYLRPQCYESYLREWFLPHRRDTPATLLISLIRVGQVVICTERAPDSQTKLLRRGYWKKAWALGIRTDRDMVLFDWADSRNSSRVLVTGCYRLRFRL